MGRTVNQFETAKQSSSFRRLMVACLAFVYLFVGIAHGVSCLDEAVASSYSVAKMADSNGDGGAKIGISICDHCPACVPAVMPAPAVVTVPSALTCQPLATVAAVLPAGYPWLDTPPPKFPT
jgi:hypothetical protein